MTFENIAEIGDTVRAHDFQPGVDRGDCYIEGVVVVVKHKKIGRYEAIPHSCFVVEVTKDIWNTVTFDNGGEFAEHEKLISETGVQAFFCDPHSPWQRGAIENTNGVIGRDMPRKTDMADYSHADLDDIMWAVNLTPRKCLGYRTPAEAFIENLRIALEM